MINLLKFFIIWNSILNYAIAETNNYTRVSAGYDHLMILKQEGSVWTWGDNQYGQLGNGSWLKSFPYPSEVENLNGVIDISAGTYFTLALREDGTVWA